MIAARSDRGWSYQTATWSNSQAPTDARLRLSTPESPTRTSSHRTCLASPAPSGMVV